MKTKTIFLSIVISITCSFSQNWVNNYNFPSGYEVTQIQFLNTNTGWVTIQSGFIVKFFKTIDKGRNWTEINTYDLYPWGYQKTFFVFTDPSFGYRSHTPGNGTYTILDKTTDGGNSWTRKVNLPDIDGTQSLIVFPNSNTGYLLIDNRYSPFNLQIWRTTDRFETYQQVYNQNPGLPNYGSYEFKNRDIIPYANGSISGVGYDEHGSYTDFYHFSYDGNFHRSFGTGNTNLRFLYLTNINGEKYAGTQSNGNYLGTRFYVDFYEQNSNQIDPQTGFENVGGMSFSDNSKGFVTIGNKIYITNNSGGTWIQEGTLGSSAFSQTAHHRLKTCGDVGYAASTNKFHTREILENLNTNFDWQGSIPGSMAIDGINYGTPSSQYIRGGTCSFYALPYIISGNDTTARFYYWGGNLDGSLAYSHNLYFINANQQVNADYKTKLKSTTTEALKNANQVKVLKDTNGVTNLLYESMQGIFYSRTRPDGNFKAEEVVSGSNGYVTYNNTNPYIAEIQRPYKPAGLEAEQNMAACWEQRDGNNIKIYVKYRDCLTYTPYFTWNSPNAVLYTIYNAPEGFKCLPKIFYLYNYNYNMKVLTFLKPDGSYKKLVAKIFKSNDYREPEYDLVSTSNLEEYAIASIPKFGSSMDLEYFNQYIVYRMGQNIYYQQRYIGWDRLQNVPLCSLINHNNGYPISNLDNSYWRASLDISLKNLGNSSASWNMQPVVTYQGRRGVIIRLPRDGGEPIEIQGDYYPIYATERSTSGWTSRIEYNSPLNVVQQTPVIEGSKQGNSCILSYTQNSTLHKQVVPRWQGEQFTNTWWCEPASFTGIDARLIKAAGIDNSSTNQKLMTLSTSGNIYAIGQQSFIVTSLPSSPGYQYVYGTVIDDNVKYSFNLGDIMINWDPVNFSDEIDTTIEDGSDFNENLKSKTFYLNENDTLVIGRTASYVLNDSSGTFNEVEYQVQLVNKTSGEQHALLVHDTLQVNDTIDIEFLEGFIIQGIQGGADSFYVQMEVDTLFLDGGNLGMGAGIQDQSYGDSKEEIKKRVFWNEEIINTSAKNNLPTVFNLHQNFPNPFNPITKIKYDIPKNVNVTIKIYDLLGREVTTLINNENKNPGWYEVEWNGTNYASGVYIYRIKAGDYVNTKKMVLIK